MQIGHCLQAQVYLFIFHSAHTLRVQTHKYVFLLKRVAFTTFMTGAHSTTPKNPADNVLVFKLQQ